MSGTISSPDALSADYSLRPETIEAFQRDGHVVVRGLLAPDEVETYRSAIKDAMTRCGKLQMQVEDESDDVYSRAFTQRINLWLLSEKVKEYVFSRRFAKVAAQLMGVAGVRLYHDQALFKEAHGGYTPWHQDHYYWPLETDRACTLWMPLVDCDESMGTMSFASGSHEFGYMGSEKITDDSDRYFDRVVSERGFKVHHSKSLKAGDATFHSAWTVHRAPGNDTDRVREVMTIIYYEDGSRLKKPENQNQSMDLAAYFPDCRAGDPAASRLNPALYRG